MRNENIFEFWNEIVHFFNSIQFKCATKKCLSNLKFQFLHFLKALEDLKFLENLGIRLNFWAD